MAISVTPLHPVFVGAVSGIDLRQEQDRDTIQALEDAINRFAILVFHDQHITDDQQMAFSRNFGELETTVRAYRKDFVPRPWTCTSPTFPTWTRTIVSSPTTTAAG